MLNDLGIEKEKNGVSLKDIEEARDRLRGICLETKLIYSPIFSLESGNKVYIKPENLQVTGAFKIRGAYNKICSLTKGEKERGLIASSAGNHAQGVAYSAKLLSVNATIVMPKTTPLIKIKATRDYGAKVILAGDFYDEAYEEAKKIQSENNYIFIHPFNDRDVIAGQGTIGLEIVEELKDVDIILVPVGGGGLISGVAIAAKKINPNIKIIGVEPEGAKAMKLSLENKKLTRLTKVETLADGVAVKEPGDITFEIAMKYVDEIITVSDYDLMESLLVLLEKHKLISEPSGALPLAALKKIKEKDKNIVCLISGGNIDVVTISTLLNHGLVARGRIFCFSVKLPDTPGELTKISKILADHGANVIKLDHNQFKSFDRFRHVLLEITLETNGQEHIREIIDVMKKEGYNITKVY